MTKRMSVKEYHAAHPEVRKEMLRISREERRRILYLLQSKQD
jgi:hypothetical protein